VYTILTVLHVIVCIFLMLVVLLQAGRGGGMGIAFGGAGGSQSVFGSSGGANFLTKMTAICAFIFFANSLVLAYISSQSDSRQLQKIAAKKAAEKKAEEASTAKLASELAKAREAAQAAKPTASGGAAGATETAGDVTEEKPGAPAASEEAVPQKTRAKTPATEKVAPGEKPIPAKTPASEKTAPSDKPTPVKKAASAKKSTPAETPAEDEAPVAPAP
jgi:preprotein translocase subunit SecG